MIQGACAAKNPRSFGRVTRLRNSTCPAASAPRAWKTCFAMSNPIVVTCSVDASFSDSSTPSPWHADAVGGRPPHHPRSSRRHYGLSSASPCRCHPSVPPRRTATSRKPMATSSVAARADRRSILQTITIGRRRAASSPTGPGRSASGTLTAPGKWPAVNSSGWRTSTTTASPDARRRSNSATSIHVGASTRGRRNNRDRNAIPASTPRQSGP